MLGDRLQKSTTGCLVVLFHPYQKQLLCTLEPLGRNIAFIINKEIPPSQKIWIDHLRAAHKEITTSILTN